MLPIVCHLNSNNELSIFNNHRLAVLPYKNTLQSRQHTHTLLEFIDFSLLAIVRAMQCAAACVKFVVCGAAFLSIKII